MSTTVTDLSTASQPVLTPLTGSAIFLVLTLDVDGESQARALLADLAGLQRSVGSRAPEAGLVCVAGIGSDAWDRLFPGPRPARLHPFREIVGERHTAVSTSGDLLFHIRAASLDLCFELATDIVARLVGAATVVDEVHGFKYFGGRSLIGFVDGTENPRGAAAVPVVTIAEDDPAFAGGSYVIVQKYVHDLGRWNALAVEEQERVIGRTKLTDIELPDDVKPSNSHVALNTITEDDGTEVQILRDNMPFGRVGVGEFGTYFIGYASRPEAVERMLRNMFVGDPPGNYDRLLDFSTPVTGCLFFVPTTDFLEQPNTPIASDLEPLSPLADGSLGIGSLKRSNRA